MEETKDLVKQFLSKEGLQYYDGKIKSFVAEQIADAKDYADGLVTGEDGSRFDAAGSAAQALAAAKAYADGLATNYDAAGSAAAAEDAAKAEMETRGLKEGEVLGTAAYADTTDFDAAGSAAAAQAAAEATAAADATAKANAAQAAAEATAAADATTKADAALAAAKEYAEGLNTAMDTRVQVLEAIDHDKLAADASAAAVATVLDGAPEKFDTLKEVAQWISDSETAASAADLVTRVAALEAIDHEAYKGADETVLANAKAYTDNEIDEISEAFSALEARVKANEDNKANAADVYTKEEVYTKAEVEAMVITNEEIDALFAVAAE